MKYLCLIPTSLYDTSSYEKALKTAYEKDVFKVVKGLDKAVRLAAEKLSNGVPVYTIMSDNAAQRLAKIIRSNPDLFSEVRPGHKALSYEMRHLFVSKDRIKMRHFEPSNSEHKPGIEWLESLDCLQTYLMLYPLFEHIHTSDIEPGMYSLTDFESSGFAPLVSDRSWETRHIEIAYELFCGNSHEDFEEDEDSDFYDDDDDLEDEDPECAGSSEVGVAENSPELGNKEG